METTDLLADAFERIRQESHRAVDGLDAEELAWRPDAAANSIAWLVWHLTRVQDDHIADLADREQTWTTGPWVERFGPGTPSDIGYGHTAVQVGAVRPSGPDLLIDYHDAVLQETLGYIDGVTAETLDEIIDRRWDPPVTAGVRIVSVISDCLQHAGQANYVRGLLERRTG